MCRVIPAQALLPAASHGEIVLTQWLPGIPLPLPRPHTRPVYITRSETGRRIQVQLGRAWSPSLRRQRRNKLWAGGSSAGRGHGPTGTPPHAPAAPPPAGGRPGSGHGAGLCGAEQTVREAPRGLSMDPDPGPQRLLQPDDAEPGDLWEETQHLHPCARPHRQQRLLWGRDPPRGQPAPEQSRLPRHPVPIRPSAAHVHRHTDVPENQRALLPGAPCPPGGADVGPFPTLTLQSPSAHRTA